jgi:hypothetical protein
MRSGSLLAGLDRISPVLWSNSMSALSQFENDREDSAVGSDYVCDICGGDMQTCICFDLENEEE